MNEENVITELTQKYPGKKIIKNDIDIPTEIICEVKPTADHPKYSMAVAIIDKTLPHYHNHSTEEYSVTKGTLTLHVENKTIILHEKETFIIQPKQIHWAEGDATWITCFSEPGWTQEDHILTSKPD